MLRTAVPRCVRWRACGVREAPHGRGLRYARPAPARAPTPQPPVWRLSDDGLRADTTLLNDVGLSGWELAEQLKRSEITAIKPGPDWLGYKMSPRATADDARGRRASTGSARRKQPENTAATAGSSPTAGGGSGLEESRKLKAELKARGLSAKGSKAELRARLAAAKAADG